MASETVGNVFIIFLEFIFGWLPPGLYDPLMGVLSAAFLIILIKIILAVVEVITRVVDLFIPG